MSARIDIDYVKLDAILCFKVTLDYCADYLECSKDTIQRRIKEDHDKTFSEYHALKLQRTAVKLQQRAIELALAGKSHAVLIFALKNLAGWTDKNEQTIEAGKSILLAYNLEGKG